MFFHETRRERTWSVRRCVRRDLDEVRLEERCETVSQALQGPPEGRCKLCSRQAWITVSSVLLWPGLQPCHLLSSLFRIWQVDNKQTLFSLGLMLKLGRQEERRGSGHRYVLPGWPTTSSRDLSSSSKRKPQTLT